MVKLSEFQKRVIDVFHNTNKNILISAPTGTGKSFLAMLLSNEANGRVLYTVPLKALALQLNDDFQKKISTTTPTTALTSEVYDEDPENIDAKIIFTTYEKADAVLRRHYGWTNNVKMIIIDEIHNVGDKERGKAIENLMAYAMNEGIRLIMMSATIPDIDKIANVTNAEVLQTDERPIPIYKAIKIGKTLFFEDGDKIEMKDDLVTKLTKKGKVVMIFTSTRKKAEELYLIYDKRYRERVAFFHAGLEPDAKLRLLEETKAGKYNIIITTTALGQGVNFPFYAVIFDDLKLPIIEYGRFIGWRSLTPIEFDQICGRAGRPGYDEEGLCVIEATDIKEAEKLARRYFNVDYGSLTPHHVLEDFILATVSKYVYMKEDELKRITKYTLSFKDLSEGEIIETTNKLVEAKILGHDNTGYYTTTYGRAVAESYFDVRDAIAYKDVLDRDNATVEDIVNAVLENRNVMDASKGENVRTIFENWIKGVDDKIIVKSTKGMSLHDLNKLVETLAWQTYGVYRISKALGKVELAKKLQMLYLETRYGVPSEALALVRLPGIGRKRAVQLMRAGIHNKTELCTNKTTAKSVLGEKMVEVICR
ncbi:Holliday junction branch migration helicase [Betalipothrixvirus pezzuloense]|uniref:Putative helicase n=1 Tax=Betalipothrixvirus pezzuloense TaxID=346883 RepID=A7WKM3_9VIRU|nr:Holliday junction branch migration helicase [Acidianus filamentous virus 7]CAJ31623.1 putative helicase [Acidianus filamentous virus 7]